MGSGSTKSGASEPNWSGILKDCVAKHNFENWDAACSEFRATHRPNFLAEDFSSWDLGGVNLASAIFIRCNLAETNLSQAKLSDASFWYCDLSDANLSEAVIDGTTFCGSNLDRALVPSQIQGYERILTVLRETVQHSRSLLYLILSYCAVVIVTVVSSGVERLVIGTTETVLPGFEQTLALSDFFIGAAVFGTLAFLYFHIFLNRWWQAINSLPATLSDGHQLKDILPPSIVGFVSIAYLRRFEAKKTAAFPLKNTPNFGVTTSSVVANILLWWLLPVTQLIVGMAVISSVGPWQGVFVAAIVVASFLVSTASIRVANKAFSPKPRQWVGAVFAIVGAIYLVIGISFAALTEVRNLVHMALSPNFAGIRLHDVQFGSAIFRKSNFEGASMVGSDFSKVAFEGIPIFSGADLKKTRFANRDLRGAKFYDATLDDADLNGADLSEGRFDRASMKSVDMKRAKLRNAVFLDTDLENANLSGVLGEGVVLQRANLKNSTLRNANLNRSLLEDAVLVSANLQGALLSNSTLANVDFTGADLRGTNFKSADLRNANLEFSKGLTVSQLEGVSTLYNAKLNKELGKSLREGRPDLFDVPGHTQLSHIGINGEISSALVELRRRIAASDLPKQAPGKKLLAAVWNIRDFGKRRRTKKALHMIAEIISHFGIVGIVELRRDLRDIREVLKILGSRWGVVVSGYGDDRAANRERMAILYDRSQATFTGYATLALERRKRNSDSREYELLKSWYRRPYAASFEAGNFDFTFVLVHMRWGQGVASRVGEWSMLTDWIERRASAKGVIDKDIIVAGDFNITSYDSKQIRILTKSGWQLPPDMQANVAGTNLRKNRPYDLFLYNPAETRSLTGNVGVLDFAAGGLKTLFPDLTKNQATYQLSDHLPLWLELDLWARGESIDFPLSDLHRRTLH